MYLFVCGQFDFAGTYSDKSSGNIQSQNDLNHFVMLAFSVF